MTMDLFYWVGAAVITVSGFLFCLGMLIWIFSALMNWYWRVFVNKGKFLLCIIHAKHQGVEMYRANLSRKNWNVDWVEEAQKELDRMRELKGGD